MNQNPSRPSSLRCWLSAGLLGGLLAASSALAFFQEKKETPAAAIELLVRADDMGAAQAFNEGCLRSFRDGIARSVEVIVPGPWFLDAVRRLREAPGLDVGVHLCLTSEWDGCKWRPLTNAPSLVDADGYFFPLTGKRQGFPAGASFLEANPKLEEVERELRAQIETARRNLPGITHVSAHMGTAVATPELRALTERLAREHGLILEAQGLKHARGFTGGTAAEREASLVRLIEGLEPGRWLLVEHPSLDSPEARALGHRGNDDVAPQRQAVLDAFTSPRVKEAVSRRGVHLINYADLRPAASR
jgi:hypothetical protein